MKTEIKALHELNFAMNEEIKKLLCTPTKETPKTLTVPIDVREEAVS